MNTVLVSGSLAYDRIMNFPGYFRDHIMPEKLHALSVSFTVGSLKETFGGTAGNIAYTLALLKEKPLLLSTAGADFEKYRQWLLSNGIKSNSIEIVPELTTAGAYVITDKADNQITAFHAGATNRPYTKKIPSRAALGIISPSNPTDMKELPTKFRKLNIPYFYDPGQQIPMLSGKDLRAGISGAEALFGNDYEIELMSQKTGWPLQKMLMHTKMVVTTLGAKGSRISTPDKEYICKPVVVEKSVDPTGAGDAYRAGFIKGFLNKLSLQQIGQVANTAGSYAVEKRGTQERAYTWKKFEERYKKTYGEALDL